MTPPATAADEMPVFFDADGDALFGVWTRPTGDPNGTAVLLLSGAGRAGGGVPSPGRNRIWVRLARSLAADGFAALRMDYSGIGESTGANTDVDLASPLADEVTAAVRWLRAQGADNVVLVGTCFGGRSALAAAPQLDEVSGVALLGSPLLDFKKGARLEHVPLSWYARKSVTPSVLRGLWHAERRRTYARVGWKKVRRVVRHNGAGRAAEFKWVSPHFVRHLDALVQRRVPVLLVYGPDDPYYEDLCRAREGALGPVFDRGNGVIELDLVEGRVHGLTTVAVQEAAAASTTRWLLDLAGRRREPAEGIAS